MASTVPFYDVAVVGAGAYGTAVLGQISLRKIPDDGQPNFRILVVERGQDLGPGRQYSKYMTIPEHNIIFPLCVLLKSLALPFITWDHLARGK